MSLSLSYSITHSLVSASECAPTASPELTLQDVATQAGIKSLDILDQECSQQVLLSLAKHCVDWQLIGFHLELMKADIVAVDGDYRSVGEERVGMLERWKEKFAFKATYRVLIAALLSCGKTSDAIEGCKAIVSSKHSFQFDEYDPSCMRPRYSNYYIITSLLTCRYGKTS